MNSQVQSVVQKLFPQSQDSYITTRVGITIPPSHCNAEDNRFVQRHYFNHKGIKSLWEDGDNLIDFHLVSNLEAMLREFLILILLFYY
ncbi:hypothetical protein Tco_0157633 [Tanacetum coccineum]